MKRRDLERHLREHGCRLIDEGANHTRWAAAAGKRRSAVPRHREIDYRLAPHRSGRCLPAARAVMIARAQLRVRPRPV